MVLSPLIVIGIVLAFFLAGARVIQEYERGVIFRLGRFAGVKPAGFRWIVPLVDRMVKISLREIVMDVPAQEVITRDNVSLKVNAVLYFRVLHPEKAVIQVENYLYGTSQLSQTTLRSVCGQAELDELLAERDQHQPPAPGDHRHGDGAVGRQGARRRGEADRSAAGDAARDGEAGRGRAREALEDHPRRGRGQAAERLLEAARILARDPARCSCATCRRWRRSRPRRTRRSCSRCRSTC